MNYTTTYDEQNRTAYLCSTVYTDCRIVIDFGRNIIYTFYGNTVEKQEASEVSVADFGKQATSFFDEIEKSFAQNL